MSNEQKPKELQEIMKEKQEKFAQEQMLKATKKGIKKEVSSVLKQTLEQLSPEDLLTFQQAVNPPKKPINRLFEHVTLQKRFSSAEESELHENTLLLDLDKITAIDIRKVQIGARKSFYDMTITFEGGGTQSYHYQADKSGDVEKIISSLTERYKQWLLQK